MPRDVTTLSQGKPSLHGFLLQSWQGRTSAFFSQHWQKNTDHVITSICPKPWMSRGQDISVIAVIKNMSSSLEVLKSCVDMALRDMVW